MNIALSPTQVREFALRQVSVTMPANGALMLLAESYFDETNTHKGSERLCVGGYVFLKEKAEEQAERWTAMLDKWGLPYFHMVDCAHRAEKFSSMSKDECDLAAREAIHIIKDTASAGVCVTMLESDYAEIMPKLSFYGSAYDALARDVINGVAVWIKANDFDGLMHYYFESGVESENNASHRILEMMKEPEIRREARYAGHSFVEKVLSPGVQAADILAWHAGQDCRRALRGERMRKDFQSLTEIPHYVVHYNRRMLEGAATIIRDTLRDGGLTEALANEIDGFAKRNPKRGGLNRDD